MGHARRITRAALVLTALTAILAPCARADAARHDGSRPSGAELGDVATRGASTRGASTRGDVDALDAATCAARVNAAIDPPPREANQSPPPPPSATAPRVATEFLDDRYIVRFRDYRMVGAHRASLERVLGPPRNAADLDANLYAHDDPPADPASAVAPARWEWIERRNKAAKHPTDFAVVRLERRRRRDVARAVTERFSPRRVAHRDGTRRHHGAHRRRAGRARRSPRAKVDEIASRGRVATRIRIVRRLAA